MKALTRSIVRAAAWSAILIPIVLGAAFARSLSIGIDFAAYLVGLWIVVALLVFVGDRLLRRFLPSLTDLSDLSKGFWRALGVGVVATMGVAGHSYFIEPSLWQYAWWTLPMNFFIITGVLLLAMLLRSKLATK